MDAGTFLSGLQDRHIYKGNYKVATQLMMAHRGYAPDQCIGQEGKRKQIRSQLE